MVGDEEVAALLQAGDHDGAATRIIKLHGPAVLDYLRASLRDDDLASDAFSLFAEWVWRAMPKYRAEASARAWAFGVASNALRRVRSDTWQARRQRFPTSEAVRIAADVRTASAARRARDEDELEALRRHLTDDERNLLLLRLQQRLDWNDIAVVLSSGGETVTAAALRKRFERVKARMAQLARERGLA